MNLLCFLALTLVVVNCTQVNQRLNGGVRVSTSCEGGIVVLECSRDLKTYVMKAEYGTSSSCMNHHVGAVTSCGVMVVTSQIRLLCTGKYVCHVNVDGTMMLNTASLEARLCLANSENHLEVQYRCLSDCSPPQVQNDVAVIGNSYAVGSNVTLHCPLGFIPKDTHGTFVQRIRCTENGEWDAQSISCEGTIRCNEPVITNNSKVILDGERSDYQYMGRPLNISCSEGFVMVAAPSAQLTIYCNQNGEWSNANDTEFPFCRAITCQITDDIKSSIFGSMNVIHSNGTILTNTAGVEVPYNTIITYKCKPGFINIGGSFRKCVGTTSMIWTGSNVRCEKDNGIQVLTNFQIALLASITSAVVILTVGAALVASFLTSCKSRRSQDVNDANNTFYCSDNLSRNLSTNRLNKKKRSQLCRIEFSTSYGQSTQ
uniref:sushi, von Willebrand factor type A, EGF and pentraxin domain-containing protein 1-like isoform X2 n=1 Tax=Ciona intestinalis TaxID=7719 RepID=UPI000EF46ECF|nr:sushi, von Willebrand factor type A, EGF and pentraxin domain-containing protein 1-like isoform X2 [Ciona intestinalis]|eukprot:XP_026694230.1 sushi, von Willebrand factor type A, EGF and pentraxin domain-containing protein 1-like isoform X2 [Ciona intestinalis]